MNEIFLRHLNTLINCDPKQCAKENCPLYLDNGDCTWENVLCAFDMNITEKFQERNQAEHASNDTTNTLSGY